MLKVGDIVQNRIDKRYGTVELHKSGFAIHSWNRSGSFTKALAFSAHDIHENWDIVEMPAGYKKHEYGGIIKL